MGLYGIGLTFLRCAASVLTRCARSTLTGVSRRTSVLMIPLFHTMDALCGIVGGDDGVDEAGMAM